MYRAFLYFYKELIIMKKTIFAAASVLFCQLALAAGIQLGDAYSYPTMEGMQQGGVFLPLTNTDKKDDVLVGASIDKSLVDKVELHTHINENGVMKMREVKGGIPLPAGKTTELKRGSFHIMFFGLKKMFKVGDTFPLTLKFKNNKPQTVTVTVREQTHKTGDAHNHDHSHEHDMKM